MVGCCAAVVRRGRGGDDRAAFAAALAAAEGASAAGPRKVSRPGPTTRSGRPEPSGLPTAPEEEPGRKVPWPVVALLALALLALPIGLVWFTSGDAAGELVVVEETEEPMGPLAGDDALGRQIPPNCDSPEIADSQRSQLAVMERGGCPVLVTRDGGDLIVDAEAAEPTRFEVGRASDDILIADFTCSGVDTPAVYRPSTGEVFVFQRWADVGEPLVEVRGDDSGITGGERQVTFSDQGCAVPEVTEPAPPV